MKVKKQRANLFNLIANTTGTTSTTTTNVTDVIDVIDSTDVTNVTDTSGMAETINDVENSIKKNISKDIHDYRLKVQRMQKTLEKKLISKNSTPDPNMANVSFPSEYKYKAKDFFNTPLLGQELYQRAYNGGYFTINDMLKNDMPKNTIPHNDINTMTGLNPLLHNDLISINNEEDKVFINDEIKISDKNSYFEDKNVNNYRYSKLKSVKIDPNGVELVKAIGIYLQKMITSQVGEEIIPEKIQKLLFDEINFSINFEYNDNRYCIQMFQFD